VRFSQLVVEQRWIKEIDINPLLASHRADHRARCPHRAPRSGHRCRRRPAALTPSALPGARYSIVLHLHTGEDVSHSPDPPEDEPMMAAFNRTLSPYSIYLRYFHPVSPAQLVSHDQLGRLCFVDYDREMSLVAERRDERGRTQIVGMGQLTKLQGTTTASLPSWSMTNISAPGWAPNCSPAAADRPRREAGARRR
jgi:acetyltransferase